MRAWLATAGSGDSGKTRPPAAAREEDIRQQAKDAASCYFTDLLKLGGDRRRGAPSAEFKEKERARRVLVGAYVESYDVATNPMAAEGEKLKVVQQRRREQVEKWWHSSSGAAEALREENKWSVYQEDHADVTYLMYILNPEFE